MTDPVSTVVLSVTPALTTLQRQNLGRTRIWGIQNDVETRVGQFVTVSGGYLYNQAKVTKNDVDPTLVGKFLLQVGAFGKNGGSNDLQNFGRVAKIWVDPKANEAYVADGYLNKRVAVLDADTGKMKRYWGAYGNKPDDTPLPPYDPAAKPAQQFYNPVHCADMSADRLIYVCDRVGDRLQVFTPEGKFVKEGFFAKNTKASGAVWDIAFSRILSRSTSSWPTA